MSGTGIMRGGMGLRVDWERVVVRAVVGFVGTVVSRVEVRWWMTQ